MHAERIMKPSMGWDVSLPLLLLSILYNFFPFLTESEPNMKRIVVGNTLVTLLDYLFTHLFTTVRIDCSSLVTVLSRKLMVKINSDEISRAAE